VTESVDDEPRGFILDVGHGNAAVFLDGPKAIVVDAGPSDAIADTLERNAISDVAALVVSHRHHDHTSELPSLLANQELRIEKLFLNADPTRASDSTFERQLRGAFNDSRRRSGTELQQANATVGHLMGTERLRVEVLSPGSDLALQGVGSGGLDAHALAVVLRVQADGGRSVLFGSDLSSAGFQQLIDDTETHLDADVLVYPHHGGLSGAGDEAAEEAFARALTEAVSPEVVVFSNGRNTHPNPRREVVRGVRHSEAPGAVRIICTQLGRECSATTFSSTDQLDGSLLSRGAAQGLSCSGSIRVALVGSGPVLPQGAAHLRFVVDSVGSGALCMAEIVAS
jgi:beta-lactamase superfamily II metal-dependent hydrolase